MIVVIGSGPAAISATYALVEQGHFVTILDVGTKLELGRQEIVDRMAAQEPGAWSKADRDAIAGQGRAAGQAVNAKLSFGSGYTLDTRSEALDIRWGVGKGFGHSLARGGLSNIWGSSILPYAQQDIKDWPISVDDLRPHYEAVMKFVPNTFVDDDLEEILPAYSKKSVRLELSRQGRSLLDDMEIHKRALRKSGIIHGRSRLAIHGSDNGSHRSCAYCALCLSGCPYGLIYSSAQTLGELIQSGKIEYKPDHLVEKIVQTDGEITIEGRNLGGSSPFSIKASRVFLGAGVLPTAKIVLNSLHAFDKPIRLLDSQYFIYPILRAQSVEGVETEKMHTAAQVFLEINDPTISAHLIHLQIYGYSSYLKQELDRSFLRWPLQLGAFRKQFLGRLLIGQGFIHSNESGHIELTLKKDGDGHVYLDALACPSRRALATVLKVGWKLVQQVWKLRAVPLLPGLFFPKPGSSYHSGGTFPMSHKPNNLETDTLGCLPTMDRVHLVDASVLPSIPATSITFSVMANAHRIASRAGQIDLL